MDQPESNTRENEDCKSHGTSESGATLRVAAPKNVELHQESLHQQTWSYTKSHFTNKRGATPRVTSPTNVELLQESRHQQTWSYTKRHGTNEYGAPPRDTAPTNMELHHETRQKRMWSYTKRRGPNEGGDTSSTKYYHEESSTENSYSERGRNKQCATEKSRKRTG